MPQFPLDTNTDQYQGYIRFQPIVTEYLDFGTLADGSVSPVVAVGEAVRSGLNKDDSVAEAERNGADAAALEDKINAFGAAGANKIKSIEVPKTTLGQSAGPAIQLYLPQAIQVNDTVDYENLPLGILGATAEAALNTDGKIMSALTTAAVDAGKTAIDIMTGAEGMSSRIAGLAAVRLANRSKTDAVRTLVGGATGVTVHPNSRALFKSVQLRSFAFSFKMIASSRAEAVEIQEIIKGFRTELYPEEILAAESSDIKAGYIYPNKFDITMTYKGSRVATKFLRSYLRNVTTTYNPSSMGWHLGGYPSEVDLTLNFSEPRTLSKKDIRDGF
jgi:hypothetical protein